MPNWHYDPKLEILVFLTVFILILFKFKVTDSIFIHKKELQLKAVALFRAYNNTNKGND